MLHSARLHPRYREKSHNPQNLPHEREKCRAVPYLVSSGQTCSLGEDLLDTWERLFKACPARDKSAKKVSSHEQHQGKDSGKARQKEQREIGAGGWGAAEGGALCSRRPRCGIDLTSG